jgi:hypothetical protein
MLGLAGIAVPDADFDVAVPLPLQPLNRPLPQLIDDFHAVYFAGQLGEHSGLVTEASTDFEDNVARLEFQRSVITATINGCVPFFRFPDLPLTDYAADSRNATGHGQRFGTGDGYPHAFMSTVAEELKGDFGYIDQVDRIEPYVAEPS